MTLSTKQPIGCDARLQSGGEGPGDWGAVGELFGANVWGIVGGRGSAQNIRRPSSL